MKFKFKNKKTNIRQTYFKAENNSPKMFSYYSNAIRNEDKTDKKQFNFSIFNKLFAVIMSLIVIFCLTYSSTLSKKSAVSFNVINSHQFDATADYKTYIDNELSNSILDNFKLTFKKTKFINDLKNKYPEIKSVSVSIPILGRKPVIDIEFYQPKINLISFNHNYLLNEEGKVISDNKPKDKLVEINNVSQLPITVGKSIFSKKEIDFMTEIVAQLSNKSILYSKIELTNIAFEVDMYLPNKPYLIKFNINGSARIQAGQLLAVLNKLDKDNIIPSKYIDVRVEDKVFYL